MSGQVLITGAGGYVGPHVVRAVADLGYQPVAVSRRPPEAELDERALFVEADVLAPDFLIESIAPAAEVSAVNSVDDRPIPCPGPMTKAIAEQYAALVRGENDKYKDWVEHVA